MTATRGPSASLAAATLVLTLAALLSWPLEFVVGVALLTTWPLFIVLDRMYVHQFTSTDDVVEEVPWLGMLIGLLRTLALLISLVALPLGVLAAAAIPIVIAIDSPNVSPPGMDIAVSLAIGVVELALIGHGLTYLFEREALRLMNLASPYERGWGTEPVDAGVGRDRPQIELARDEGHASSPGVESMLTRAAAQGRSLQWRRTLPVGAGLLACWVWLATPLNPDGWTAVGAGAAVGASWGFGLLFASHGGGGRFGDRTPFRQIRLGAGVVVLLTLLPFSLMLFPYVLIHWRRSLVQWIVVTSPLEGASTMLRSGLLGWVAAAGATPFVVVAMTEGADFASAFIGAAASVVVFLASTAWLGRRMKPPTEDIKLVLLRVFGSTGRTRFLFDIAANWRGLGSVVCISAPDVSTHQMEPDVLVDVLFGMLRVRFALGEPHESESLARFGRPPPLRRVVEIPASADNWKQEMRYSLTQNAIVLMDLRGSPPTSEDASSN